MIFICPSYISVLKFRVITLNFYSGCISVTTLVLWPRSISCQPIWRDPMIKLYVMFSYYSICVVPLDYRPSNTDNTCRTIANMDIKLDFVPPSLINFISRQLVGSGFRLYQKVYFLSLVVVCFLSN